MNESIFQELLQFPAQRAKEELLIGIEREYELNERHAEHLSKYISVLKAIGKDLEESGNFSTTEAIRRSMVRAFTYFFDKGVEVGHEYRLENLPRLTIDFENIFTGVHGDNIPTDLQVEVNSIIPQIVHIGQQTVDLACEKQEEHSLETEQILQAILLSGFMLGIEYSLRRSMYSTY